MKDWTHDLRARQSFAATLTLFALLIAVDLLFILVHVLHVWSPWLHAGHFSMESDDGMAELYQYIKQVWLVACLALAFLQTRGKVYIGWMMLFGFLLLDDAAQLHERIGFWLGARLGFPAAFGLRPDDFGEISFAAALGCVAVGLVALTYWRGNAQARHVSGDMLCLLGALAFFGVFFDALHTITYFRAPAVAPVFTLIEDGGEMIVVSLMTAYAFDIVSNVGRLRIGVWQRMRSWAAQRRVHRGLANTWAQ